MKPEDVYALTSVVDPRLSPDGRRVAYTVSRVDEEANAYRTAIWVAPLDGSAEPRQFTSGERNDLFPRWSPDGRWLAFVSNRDGEDEKKAKGQLYVLPANGGEPRRLTDGKESVESVAWSPDSNRIAFTRRVRDEAYDEEDDRNRAPRRFTRVFFKLDSVGWVGDRRKHVFVVGLDGEGERQLTDGDRIAFRVEDGGNVHIYTVAADGSGEPELLVGGEQSTGIYDLVDGALVYTASTHTRPHELFGGDGKRITSVADDFVAERELADVERFTARSADGTEVEAWLVRPPDFDGGRRYPVLLTIHGGPFSQYGTGFFDEVQVYAGA